MNKAKESVIAFVYDKDYESELINFSDEISGPEAMLRELAKFEFAMALERKDWVPLSKCWWMFYHSDGTKTTCI